MIRFRNCAGYCRTIRSDAEYRPVSTFMPARLVWMALISNATDCTSAGNPPDSGVASSAGEPMNICGRSRKQYYLKRRVLRDMKFQHSTILATQEQVARWKWS